MGLTIVLSGSSNTRDQAIAVLRHAGFEVDPTETSSHGFPEDGGLGWITAHGDSLDRAVQLVSHLEWNARSHWTRTGRWQKLPGTGSLLEVSDPMAELEKLKAQLRAQGIKLEG